MDPGFRSPLIDFFRRGEVARDVRLLAAQGGFAPRAQEQLALLVLLSDDPDPEIARETASTLDALPVAALTAFLARSEVPKEMRQFFAGRGIEVPPGTVAAPDGSDDPLVDTLSELPDVLDNPPADAGDGEPERLILANLSVMERMKLAMKGTREQRGVLVRDANKLVSSAVLSSPKLTEAEVEAFTKMGNVGEEVLRVIGTNRRWLKNYGVIMGLCRHPKTPPAISMQLVHRLNEKDLKQLQTDRNVQEGLRVLAKKIVTKGKV
jgi:hypothetical protein